MLNVKPKYREKLIYTRNFALLFVLPLMIAAYPIYSAWKTSQILTPPDQVIFRNGVAYTAMPLDNGDNLMVIVGGIIGTPQDVWETAEAMSIIVGIGTALAMFFLTYTQFAKKIVKEMMLDYEKVVSELMEKITGHKFGE